MTHQRATAQNFAFSPKKPVAGAALRGGVGAAAEAHLPPQFKAPEASKQLNLLHTPF
jgi:hypothetical protein